LKYAFAYLYAWQEPATLPQLIGNVVHRVVELLYGNDPSDRRRHVAQQMLHEAFEEECSRPAYRELFTAGDPGPQVIETGQAALDGLFEIEDPSRVTVGPEGLEVWVEADLYGAPVRGRIDRLYDASGAQVVADYKTGRVPQPRYTEKAFFGLWTYAAALAASDPDHILADRIELLYLTGRERLSRPVLHAVALEHAKTLARIWREIRITVASGKVIARRSKLCDWCAFKPICPVHVKNAAPPGSAEQAAAAAAAGLVQRARRDVAVALERATPPDEEEGA
jgi:putative RecB family exonuclease